MSLIIFQVTDYGAWHSVFNQTMKWAAKHPSICCTKKEWVKCIALKSESAKFFFFA